MATPPKNPEKSAENAKPLLKVEDVPKEIRDYALEKSTPTKDDGSPDKAPSITAAKEGGSYYGKVVSNTDKYLVQLVGQEKTWLIVHPKDKIDLQGAKLQKMDADKRLNNTSLQIHYTADQAKAYPWTAKEKAEPKALTQEGLLEQAKKYALENIKNASQRTSFVKHLEKVADQAFAPAEPSRKQPDQEKQGAEKNSRKTPQQDMER